MHLHGIRISGTKCQTPALLFVYKRWVDNHRPPCRIIHPCLFAKLDAVSVRAGRWP